MENLFGPEAGDALFLRYFYFRHNPTFNATALPGNKENVSGGVVIPFSLGICKYISEERKKAAAEFLKFVSLKETQKKIIIDNYMFSGITEFYDEEEVCSKVACNVIKDSYPFSFMNYEEHLFADDNYHVKYREKLFEYLFNNRSLDDVLNDVAEFSGYVVSRRNIGGISFFLSLTLMLCYLLF